MKHLILLAALLAASAAYAGNLSKGAELVKTKACVSCHGENMNKPNDATVPKLAGQYEDYLFVALKAYKTKNNAIVGRGNAVMAGFAATLTSQEMKDIAAYIASLPGDLKVAPEPKTRLGETK